MNTNTATEYRNLPLAVLTESATNPRRIFEDAALRELAESIRSQGVLSPCLYGLSQIRVSRSSPEPDAIVLRKWWKPQPFPSASSTSPTPRHWRRS